MLSITKIFEFDAAHRLLHHEGKCKNLHGHTYKLEIEVAGKLIEDKSSQHMMLMDFGNLKDIVKARILDRVDHSFLNDMPEFDDHATAELMVNVFRKWLAPGLPENVELVRLRLWETSTSYAEWKPSERIMETRYVG